jgi:hypothetical protein
MPDLVPEYVEIDDDNEETVQNVSERAVSQAPGHSARSSFAKGSAQARKFHLLRLARTRETREASATSVHVTPVLNPVDRAASPHPSTSSGTVDPGSGTGSFTDRTDQSKGSGPLIYPDVGYPDLLSDSTTNAALLPKATGVFENLPRHTQTEDGGTYMLQDEASPAFNFANCRG